MELRFLKGKWEFGRFKLQYRKNKNGLWLDVPTVEEKQPEEKEKAK